MLLNSKNIKGSITCVIVWLHLITSAPLKCFAEENVWVAKGVAYKSIVRQCMEYACVVWNPHTAEDCSLLDAVIGTLWL